MRPTLVQAAAGLAVAIWAASGEVLAASPNSATGPVGNDMEGSDLVPLQGARLEQVAATMPEIGPLTPAVVPVMPTARALETLRHKLAAKKTMPDVAPARAPVRHRLELKAARSGAESTFRQPPSLTESWHGTVGVDGEFEYGDLLSMKFQGDFVDLRRPGGDGDEEGFWFAETETDGWEENAVNDARISLEMFDDRLRLTSRRAWSRYSGSTSYLSEEDDDEGKGRFLNHEGAGGSAVLHRLDAEVLRWGEADLSMFARYQKVDPFFQSLVLSDNDGRDASDKKDPFAEPNEEVVEFGTTLGVGPAKLTLSRASIREIIGNLGEDEDEDEDDVSRELRHEASLGLSLEDVRDRLGDRVPEGLWMPLPESVWVSVAEGRVEEAGGGDSPDDRTGDVSFGLSWSWSGGYADVSYWRSLYDSRGPFVDEYDWNGDGLDLTFGLYNTIWSLGAALGVNRAEDEASASRSTDLSIDGSLWLTLRPEDLPDVKFGASLGRYGTDYIAYNEAIRTGTWEVSVELEFSKYLADPDDGGQPRLALMYRFEGDHTRDGFTGESGDSGHTGAILLQLRF